MKRLLTLLLLLLPVLTWAQNGNVFSDTITWSSDHDKNLKTGDTFVRDITFVTYDSMRIDMIIDSNSKTLEVTGMEGIWPGINVPGQILYHVLFGDTEGTVLIRRDDAELTLILDLSKSSPSGIRNQYFIEHTSVN